MVSIESLTRVYWIAYWAHWIAYWIACLSCFCFYHLSVAISGQAAQAAQPFGGSQINNILVTMSSKMPKLRTSVKRPSAALPCRPIIVPFKNKKTGGTTLWMQRSGCRGTLDVEALNGETITLMIKEGCLSLDIIRVGTLTGETITLDVKASSTSWISPRGATKDTLIAQLNILVEELNKILHEDVYVSLTSLMVTIGKVKAIRILLDGL